MLEPWSVGQSVGQWVGRSAGRSVGQLVGRAVGRSVGRSAIKAKATIEHSLARFSLTLQVQSVSSPFWCDLEQPARMFVSLRRRRM